jgi:DNA-directed RNA polymerase specialized sigma24 family protein
MALPPFQTLLDSYGGDVHRLLTVAVGVHDADDCYQETWIAALRAYPRLQHDQNLRGWLLTIASRKAIDCVRARKRAPLPVGEPRGRRRRPITLSLIRRSGRPCGSCRQSSGPRLRCATASTPTMR